MTRIHSSAVVALALAAGGAFAAPLNLSPALPDVASGFILVTYDANTSIFSATGVTQNVTLPGPSSVPAGLRAFSLTCVIDNLGNASSGTLLVRSDVGGADSVNFMSSDLDAFGFGAFNKFEFIFSQQSGNLASVNEQIGTILIAPGLSFPGGVPDFSRSFSNAFPGTNFGDGNADTFVIPAPSAAGLLALGGLVAARRRRTK